MKAEAKALYFYLFMASLKEGKKERREWKPGLRWDDVVHVNKEALVYISLSCRHDTFYVRYFIWCTCVYIKTL